MLMLLTPLILSSCGGDPAPAPDLGPVDVILISGQSNAVGCTFSSYIQSSMGEDKYIEFYQGYKDIKMSYDNWTKDDFDKPVRTYYSQHKSDGFVPVKLGQGNGTATFGPEIGIAEALHEKYANKLFIIKFACGGSCLKDDWTERNSPMYPKFIAYVKQEMNRLSLMGYRPTIKAFCWMQGEGDTYNSAYYGTYKDNLRNFVTNVRSDLRNLSGEREIPFIDAKISGDGAWTYWAEVNIAKREFSEESDNNFLVDTIFAGMHTNTEPYGNVDLCHYDSASEVKLGHLFADVFEQFLLPIEDK